MADWSALLGAAQTLGLTLVPIEARGPAEWEAAFAAMASQRAQALITMQDANTYLHASGLPTSQRAAGFLPSSRTT